MSQRPLIALAVLCGVVATGACGRLPASPSSLTTSSGLQSDVSASAASSGSSLGLLGVSAAASSAASQSIVPLRVFPAGAQLAGTTTLTRTDNGVSMTAHATDLIANYAYTVWWVIFNTPTECAAPGCSVADVFANRGTPSLRLAAGHVVGDSGIGDFGGHLSEGATGGPPCSSNPATLGSCGPGLLDARAAVIHLVVRSHGPAIPELVTEQISSFTGACSVNGCSNVQVAVHLP